MSGRTEIVRLREIVARMRQYAPSLRGTGMTASDAAFNRTLADADYLDELCRKSAARIEVGPIELLALKKLALINGALAKSLTGESARREQTALLGVLMDVTARADLANETEKRTPTYEAPRDPAVPLRVRGVGRVADEPRALLLALNERPTDDEIRALHDHLSEVVIA